MLKRCLFSACVCVRAGVCVWLMRVACACGLCVVCVAYPSGRFRRTAVSFGVFWSSSFMLKGTPAANKSLINLSEDASVAGPHIAPCLDGRRKDDLRMVTAKQQ